MVKQDCLYAYECEQLDNSNENNVIDITPADIRVFNNNYCSIDYSEGYLLQGTHSGAKGKVLHFISNGVGSYIDKIKKIQERLNENDVAYFNVPEIASIIVVSKHQYMTLYSGVKIAQLLQEKANVIVNNFIEEKVELLARQFAYNTKINVAFYATDKNKKVMLDEIYLGRFGGSDVKEFKVPDEYKCGDYVVAVELER